MSLFKVKYLSFFFILISFFSFLNILYSYYFNLYLNLNTYYFSLCLSAIIGLVFYKLKSNEKKPNQADTLNYLGFALRKLGNFEEAEKYYLQGLNIKPDHNGINEYLGELYIQTNRIDLAKERLEVLKNCKCEEYDELKELIESN